MDSQLADQWAQVQKDLAQKVSEAQRLGDCLVELGLRLSQEPGKWAIDWLESAFPDLNGADLIEPELVAALDRQRLVWLLDDIRLLRRREAELRKLISA